MGAKNCMVNWRASTTVAIVKFGLVLIHLRVVGVRGLGWSQEGKCGLHRLECSQAMNSLVIVDVYIWRDDDDAYQVFWMFFFLLPFVSKFFLMHLIDFLSGVLMVGGFQNFLICKTPNSQVLRLLGNILEILGTKEVLSHLVKKRQWCFWCFFFSSKDMLIHFVSLMFRSTRLAPIFLGFVTV